MGEAKRRKLTTGTIINDYASEIWRVAGQLQGGKITLSVLPGLMHDYLAHRVLDMRLDHNDAAGQATHLRLQTSQPTSEIIDIARLGGFVAIVVDRIEAEETITDDRRFRLVHGSLKTIALADQSGRFAAETKLPGMEDGVGYHDGLNACVTFVMDAAQQPTHVHTLCLNANGTKASYKETQRRKAIWEVPL